MSGELLAVGRIARAHGVRGEVSVQSLTEVEQRFAPGSVLLLGPDGDRPLTVRSARPHQHRILVKFDEVRDRTEAESLRGRVLMIPSEQSPPLPEGAYWVHQVVGLELVTEDGRSLGRVREVLANPANDVWVTDADALIPAVREVIVDVDLGAGRAVVRDIPGLAGDG